jgi:hypothetical protein
MSENGEAHSGSNSGNETEETAKGPVDTQHIFCLKSKAQTSKDRYSTKATDYLEYHKL